METFTSNGVQTLDIPACNELLYQLQYPNYPEVANRGKGPTKGIQCSSMMKDHGL